METLEDTARTRTDKKAERMRYREAVATRATGKKFGEPLDDEAFAELREELGLLPAEVEQHFRDSRLLDTYCDQIFTIRAAKSRRPALIAQRGAILKRHEAEGYAKSRMEESERQAEIDAIQKRIDDDHAIVCAGNSFYKHYSDLVDPEFHAEIREIRASRGRLEEKRDDLRRELRPKRRVVASADPGAPGDARKNILLDAEHWSRVAQFAESEAERRAAEARLISIARKRRELADVETEIAALDEIERELATHEPDARWFKM